MAIFSIADLHLSLAADKPMDIFGHRWQGYGEKLESRWRAVVGENDTVVVPGDISWAMTLPEAEADLALEILKANGEDAYVIGKIVASEDKVTIC